LPLDLGGNVERYRTLGLAIEEAVGKDRWDEVDTLLSERDTILKWFANSQPGIDAASKSLLQACDQRLLMYLTGTRAEAIEDLRTLQDGTQLRRTYQSSGSGSSSFEQAG
jgi:hypothetical protein